MSFGRLHRVLTHCGEEGRGLIRASCLVGEDRLAEFRCAAAHSPLHLRGLGGVVPVMQCQVIALFTKDTRLTSPRWPAGASRVCEQGERDKN